MSQNDKPEYWDCKQMAEFYGGRSQKITPRTIRNWVAKGAFNGQMAPRLGRKHLFVPPTSTGTSTNAA